MTTVIPEDSDEAVVVATDETFDPAISTSIISLTRDLSLASGSQIITGVGFKPRLIIFQTGLGAVQYGSIGIAGPSFQSSFVVFGTAVYPAQSYAGIAGTNGSNFQIFVVSSFDVDGFTLTWTKTLTPTGVASVVATCFR